MSVKEHILLISDSEESMKLTFETEYFAFFDSKKTLFVSGRRLQTRLKNLPQKRNHNAYRESTEPFSEPHCGNIL